MCYFISSARKHKGVWVREKLLEKSDWMLPSRSDEGVLTAHLAVHWTEANILRTWEVTLLDIIITEPYNAGLFLILMARLKELRHGLCILKSLA